MSQNRRQFSRVPFETEARLFMPDGDYPVQVLDLSLKGALMRPKAPLYITVGSLATLKIPLDSASGSGIRMEVVVVHHLANHYGLACRDIDLDSVTHLRRLIELNLGDGALAEREFSALAAG